MSQVVQHCLGLSGLGYYRVYPLELIGMSQVVPALLGTVGTGILGGLASGTCWDVPSCPKAIFGTASVRGSLFQMSDKLSN